MFETTAGGEDFLCMCNIHNYKIINKCNNNDDDDDVFINEKTQ